MAKKELTIDEFNKDLSEKIKACEAELKSLYAQYKSESTKPQATLAECNAMARKK